MDCTPSCGERQRKFSVTVHAAFGGTKCPYADQQLQAVNDSTVCLSLACPADCAGVGVCAAATSYIVTGIVITVVVVAVVAVGVIFGRRKCRLRTMLREDAKANSRTCALVDMDDLETMPEMPLDEVARQEIVRRVKEYLAAQVDKRQQWSAIVGLVSDLQKLQRDRSREHVGPGNPVDENTGMRMAMEFLW